MLRSVSKICRERNRVFQLAYISTTQHYDIKLSTPIYYVNGEPHLGHIYSSSLADAICRWEQMKGSTTFLTTGTDEHGQKVQKEAEKQKMNVKSYCDSIATAFEQELSHYDLNIGRFIRTTDSDHIQLVHKVWDQLMANGDLYEASYRGYYCRSDEAFLTSKQIYENNGQLLSRESHNPVELVEERNWMFRLQKYKPRLLDYLASHSDWILPNTCAKEMIRTISESSQDLSVSRPLSRVPWAIEIDEKDGVYVWIDALTNYLTTNQNKSFNSITHVFGKDIAKFHCYYYPCLLMALNIPLPAKMICHSHWTVNGLKMSKSKGNYIPLKALREYIPGDLIRGFLLTQDTLDHDVDFSTKQLLLTINELADSYGNLLSRSLGKAIAEPMFASQMKGMVSPETKSRLVELSEKVSKEYDSFLFGSGYKLIMDELHQANFYFNDKHPWTLKNDPSSLCPILSNVWETLRVCSILLQPIIPNYATKALQMLREPTTLLSSVWEKSIDVSSLQFYSEKLFTKLTKQEEKLFLGL